MSLVRHFLSVGSATLASRVLGFLRDSLIAATLGTGPVADAFLVAFRLPNLFRRLFSEGAFNSAFVPLYLRLERERGADASRRFAADAFGFVAIVSVLLTALAMIGASWVVLALAPGFLSDQQKFERAVGLARVCLPYLACLSIGGVLSGLLATRRKYLTIAAIPLVLNLVTIAALAAIVAGGMAHSWQAGRILAGAVLISGLLQFGLLALATVRAGVAPRLRLPRLTPDLRRLLLLATPGLIAGGIAQINIAIATIIASLDAGAVSVLYYADRLYQLPLGVVGIAIGTVLLPEMIRAMQRERPDIAIDVQNRTLEFTALLTVPAAVALLVINQPIVEVLFERGAFGPQDTARTALAIAAFAPGLPAFVVIKVLSPAFFAREDTRTPMFVAIGSIVVNLALALALFGPLREVGIALAISVSGWVNAIGLVVALQRRDLWRSDLKLEETAKRILLSAVGMGAVLWFAGKVLDPWTGAENPAAVKFSALGALVLIGLAAYGALAYLTGAADLDRWRAWRSANPRDDDVIPPSR